MFSSEYKKYTLIFMYDEVDDNGFFYLYALKLRARYKNKGIGSKIMQEVITYCNDNKLNLTLKPSTIYGSGLKRLKKFYRGHGLVDSSEVSREVVKKYNRDHMFYLIKS